METLHTLALKSDARLRAQSELNRSQLANVYLSRTQRYPCLHLFSDLGLTPLQTLWLSKMGLDDDDGVPIGRALGSGICHLTHLVLSENFLGDDAGSAIARGLPKARSLVDLNLNSNRLSSVSAFDIIRALLTNRVLRRGDGGEGGGRAGEGLRTTVDNFGC